MQKQKEEKKLLMIRSSGFDCNKVGVVAIQKCDAMQAYGL